MSMCWVWQKSLARQTKIIDKKCELPADASLVNTLVAVQVQGGTIRSHRTGQKQEATCFIITQDEDSCIIRVREHFSLLNLWLFDTFWSRNAVVQNSKSEKDYSFLISLIFGVCTCYYHYHDRNSSQEHFGKSSLLLVTNSNPYYRDLTFFGWNLSLRLGKN